MSRATWEGMKTMVMTVLEMESRKCRLLPGSQDLKEGVRQGGSMLKVIRPELLFAEIGMEPLAVEVEPPPAFF